MFRKCISSYSTPSLECKLVLHVEMQTAKHRVKLNAKKRSRMQMGTKQKKILKPDTCSDTMLDYQLPQSLSC